MSLHTVIVSRSPEGDGEQRQFDRELIEKLVEAGATVLAVPHVYYLSPKHPAAVRMTSPGEPPAVAAWMHPRPLAWTLAALGLRECTETNCYDVRTYCCPGRCAEAILSGSVNVAGREVSRGTVETFDDAPQKRWYPVLDYSRCVGCRQCYDFCLFGVFDLEGDRVVAVEPDRCKPGCPACARVCPRGAIMFPDCPDPAIAGAPGVEIEGGPIDVEAFFSRGMAAASGVVSEQCACEMRRLGEEGAQVPETSACGCASDELDDLIEALEDLED